MKKSELRQLIREEIQSSSKSIIKGSEFIKKFEDFRETLLSPLRNLISKKVLLQYGKNSIKGVITAAGTNEGSEYDFKFLITLKPLPGINSKEQIEEFEEWYGEGWNKGWDVYLDNNVTITLI